MARDKRKPFDIPNILDSLRAKVEAGELTLREATVKLHRAGWMNFIDEEMGAQLLFGLPDEIRWGSLRLRVGDCFTARDKQGQTGHYRLSGLCRKHDNIYAILRAIGSTLEERRREVKKYNECNRLWPLAADALDTVEVEAAWFGERKITKIGGPDDE